MGWKASCIFVNEREPGYIGTFPVHNAALAKSIIGKLNLGRYKSARPSTLEEGLYPNRLTIGAYDGAAVIGIPDVFPYFEPDNRKTAALLAAFPQASILAISLHSVVNLWGYAFYEKGKCVRIRAGSADDGVFVEHGDPLPKEQELFDKSTIRDGERVYDIEIDGEIGEFSEDAMGEEFVFELSKRFLGKRIDRFDGWDMQMEAFYKSWF